MQRNKSKSDVKDSTLTRAGRWIVDILLYLPWLAVHGPAEDAHACTSVHTTISYHEHG